MIYRILKLAYNILNLAIFARAIISWLPINTYKEPVKTLIKYTDIILDPIRDVLYRFGLMSAIDISPLIAVFIIRTVYKILLMIF